MSRTSSTNPTERSPCVAWLIAIKNRGITKFSFSELPTPFRSIKMLRQAISCKLLACTGRKSNGTKRWEISSRVGAG